MFRSTRAAEMEGSAGDEAQPTEVGPLFVSEDLAAQLEMLSRFPDVISASVVTTDSNLIEVGGQLGRKVRAVPPMWARNINDYPGEDVSRHGFVVDARFQPQGDFDGDAGIAAHRTGDVCVRPELADVLSQINHPAVALIRLAVAGDIGDVEISFLKGRYPKAVRVDTGLDFNNHVILEHPFKSELASEKLGDWLAILYTATDDLESKDASLDFDGHVLTASWRFPLPQDGDFEIPPSFFSVDYVNFDLSLRTAWLLQLGSKLFDMKIRNSEEFFRGILQQARSRGMLGSVSEISRDGIFCFRKNDSGQLEVYIQMRVGHDGGGPGGGEPIPEDGDDGSVDAFGLAA